jgi:hypothetical protein
VHTQWEQHSKQKPNKWISKMQDWDGAVRKDYNPFAHVLTSQSPSLNFTFGRSHGLPLGYTLIPYGPPKGGKSVIANSFIARRTPTIPDAIVLKFDTEFREELQNASLMTDESIFGIDPPLSGVLGQHAGRHLRQDRDATCAPMSRTARRSA